MLPPKQSGPQMKNVGIYVAEDTLFRAHAIAANEGVKSRNQLLGSFLSFAVDLFPLLKPIRPQVEAFAAKEKVSYAEAIAFLVERGLKSLKK